MRICSFLPSATEIVYELGLGEDLVGVTHECDFPADASKKTVVVRSVFDASKLSSEEIDAKIVQLVRQGNNVYVVDDAALKNADPDVIVAQGLCDVCSPHMKELDRAMLILKNKPKVIVLDPHDLDEILESIMQVSKAVGMEEAGRQLIGSLRERISRVTAITRDAKEKPRVLCIEWLHPLFTAGHWVPQMVELVSGINGVSKRGQPSRKMEWNEVISFDPDIIVLMPCGFDIARTMTELWQIEKEPRWRELRAVKNQQVYITDASSYFSRPGPRTVTGLEILATVIHPTLFHGRLPENSLKKIY